MTTSAPQWPGQDGSHGVLEEKKAPARPAVVRRLPGLDPSTDRSGGDPHAADPEAGDPHAADPQATGPQAAGAQVLDPQATDPQATNPQATAQAAGLEGTINAEEPWAEGRPRLRAVPETAPRTPPPAPPDATPAPAIRLARVAGRRKRLVAGRDPTEPELRAARRRARAKLPSPVAVTRDIALALLEVEAGCRSAAQLERVFSPELWEALEHRIGRRGGPLPSGRSLIAVRCQEDSPGLADTVAVVRRGDLVRPVALRLDAGRGRWTVTELRWWRNETDTATTPARDGGPA